MTHKNQDQDKTGTDLKKVADETVANHNVKLENEGMSPLDVAIVEEKYDNNPLQTRIKNMRKRTDSLFRTVKLWGKSFGPGEIGRYANLATTSLESARHFYGKILQEKGASYPYQEKSSSQIADQGEPFESMPLDTEEACRLLRDKIEEEITEMKIYLDQITHVSATDFICQSTVVQKLIEAKCWLGEILGVVAREREAAGK